MKKLIITIIIMLVLGISLVASSNLVEHKIWHDTMVLIGGVLVGSTTGLFALLRVCEKNPNIIKEIEKLDTAS